MPAARYRSTAGALIGGAGMVVALCACGSNNPTPSPTVTVTQSASSSPSSSTSAVAATPPAMVAVTQAGALVTLNPATGVVSSTLVPANVIGDEVSVSGNGVVYFAVKHGCKDEVKSIPVGGGSVTTIATGSEPAVSPDGTKLAYVDQPTVVAGCYPQNVSDPVTLYHLKIRMLSTGATTSLPMLKPGTDSGLPYPISHLSWAADSNHLAVSIASPEDNEGWNLTVLATSQAQYYLSGTGVINVPVTGSPTPRQSYLREGVFMPNGDLFVSRACCGGIPPHNTSRLMWEVSTNGALVHQVAIGFPNLDHVSLDVTSDGTWLLYLAGTDLYVSDAGATPRKITSGLIAAAWG